MSYPLDQYGSYSAPAPPPPPPANAGWAVAAVLFFWPVSFSAFTHAFKVYPLWASGDYAGAQYASDRAKALGKLAIVLWLVIMAIAMVGYAILIAALVNSASTY